MQYFPTIRLRRACCHCSSPSPSTQNLFYQTIYNVIYNENNTDSHCSNNLPAFVEVGQGEGYCFFPVPYFHSFLIGTRSHFGRCCGLFNPQAYRKSQRNVAERWQGCYLCRTNDKGEFSLSHSTSNLKELQLQATALEYEKKRIRITAPTGNRIAMAQKVFEMQEITVKAGPITGGKGHHYVRPYPFRIRKRQFVERCVGKTAWRARRKRRKDKCKRQGHQPLYGRRARP